MFSPRKLANFPFFSEPLQSILMEEETDSCAISVPHLAAPGSGVWENVAYYVGTDPMFGKVMVVLYRPQDSSKYSSVFLSSHGISHYRNITVDPRSRYYLACQNLPVEMEHDVRRCALAITALRTYASLPQNTKVALISSSQSPTGYPLTFDETSAGDFAATMRLIPIHENHSSITTAMEQLGLFQTKKINSAVIDVIYSNESNVINDNNNLVFLLGQQLEQLFDPLTEYSPEPTEKLYDPPCPGSPDSSNSTRSTDSLDSNVVRAICNELVQVEATFTNSLVLFLQNFIVPLRVFVMNNNNNNNNTLLSITKLNSVFPPTIDEITRINCLFSEALVKAQNFGSFEIVKACGITIPYFYKAYMRHEAATLDFGEKLREIYPLIQPFMNTNSNTLSDLNSDLKIANYSIAKIESLIHSSLNLARLKLILDRLMNEKVWLQEEEELVSKYYRSSVGTIDDFATRSTVDDSYNNRIFTPTGSILPELTTDWPPELQHGSISRRVVSIVDVVNLLPETDNNYNNITRKKLDIIIIFTDNALFLTVDDNDYINKHFSHFHYSNSFKLFKDNSMHRPSIADMLMHSLVNKVPLKNLPKLRVEGWCPIQDIYASEFNNGSGLHLFVKGEGIRQTQIQQQQQQQQQQPQKSSINTPYLRLYQFSNPNKYSNTSQFVELINKAKVLSKTQPLHLFQESFPELHLFSTAHEVSTYLKEEKKFPVAILLNMEISMSFLEENDLFACYSISFTNEELDQPQQNHQYQNRQNYRNVKLMGLTKAGNITRMIIKSSSLPLCLCKEVSRAYSLFLSQFNEGIVDQYIEINKSIVDFLSNKLINHFESNSKVFKPNQQQQQQSSSSSGRSIKSFHSQSGSINVLPVDSNRSSVRFASSILQNNTKHNSIGIDPTMAHSRISVQSSITSTSKKESEKKQQHRRSIPIFDKVKTFFHRSLSRSKHSGKNHNRNGRSTSVGVQSLYIPSTSYDCDNSDDNEIAPTNSLEHYKRKKDSVSSLRLKPEKKRVKSELMNPSGLRNVTLPNTSLNSQDVGKETYNININNNHNNNNNNIAPSISLKKSILPGEISSSNNNSNMLIDDGATMPEEPIISAPNNINLSPNLVKPLLDQIPTTTPVTLTTPVTNSQRPLSHYTNASEQSSKSNKSDITSQTSLDMPSSFVGAGDGNTTGGTLTPKNHQRHKSSASSQAYAHKPSYSVATETDKSATPSTVRGSKMIAATSANNNNNDDDDDSIKDIFKYSSYIEDNSNETATKNFEVLASSTEEEVGLYFKNHSSSFFDDDSPVQKVHKHPKERLDFNNNNDGSANEVNSKNSNGNYPYVISSSLSSLSVTYDETISSPRSDHQRRLFVGLTSPENQPRTTSSRTADSDSLCGDDADEFFATDLPSYRKKNQILPAMKMKTRTNAGTVSGVNGNAVATANDYMSTRKFSANSYQSGSSEWVTESEYSNSVKPSRSSLNNILRDPKCSTPIYGSFMDRNKAPQLTSQQRESFKESPQETIDSVLTEDPILNSYEYLIDAMSRFDTHENI